MLTHFKVADIASIAKESRNRKNADLIIKKLNESMGYGFLISNLNLEHFSQESVRESLGQVETPKWVADLMAYLSIKSGNEKILDPCFGNGVFLQASYDRLESLSGAKPDDILGLIHGVEVDPFSFARGLNEFLSHVGVMDSPGNFLLGDIFDFAKKDFDVVIMNPPYVRQEKLSEANGSRTDKEVMIKKALDGSSASDVSARSNLYSYFIIHLTKHIRENGRVAAIIPKVWLDSKYGQSLQKFLLENYDVEYILDFDTDTFTGVIVEDCVLILKRGATPGATTRFAHIKKKSGPEKIEALLNKKRSFENETIRSVAVDRRTLSGDHKWGKFLHASPDMISLLLCKGLVRLGDVADIVRGTTTLWNDFFMFDEQKAKRFGIEDRFLTKILSSPKDIVGYATDRWATPSMMLNMEKIHKGNESISFSRYLKSAGDLDAPLSVRTLIKNDPVGWYAHSKPKSGPIIFSYIIRRMKNFVLNSGGYAIRDNFYIITPKKDDPLVLFGILNSSLVKMLLELSGRRYGNGLLKIQAYELADLNVPDLSTMTDRQKSDIRKLAERLSKLGFDDPESGQIIRKIDEVVHDCLGLDVGPEAIAQLERSLLEKRLGRVA